MTSKEMLTALYAFVALQVPNEKMEYWKDGLDAIQTDLDKLERYENLDIVRLLKERGYVVVCTDKCSPIPISAIDGIGDPLAPQKKIAFMQLKKGKTSIGIFVEE